MGVAMPKVVYCSKDLIYPRFGYADPEKDTVYIREDLPKKVRKFVREHELYHLQDDSKWWVWREIRASAHAAKKQPFGFIGTAFMSLAPYRLKYYWNRITGEMD